MVKTTGDPFGDPHLENIVFSTQIRKTRLTTEVLERVISEIQYKNGDREWVISFSEYPEGFLIRSNFFREDSVTHKKGWSKDVRPWTVESWRDEGYLIQTIFKSIATNEEHEMREGFRYRGVAIYGPHSVQERATKMAQETERLRV